MATNGIDLGFMAEGVVELDPLSGHFVLRYEDAKTGEFKFLDIQEHLALYKGEDVRLIFTPLSSVARLAKMVENGEIKLEDAPKVPKLG